MKQTFITFVTTTVGVAPMDCFHRPQIPKDQKLRLRSRGVPKHHVILSGVQYQVRRCFVSACEVDTWYFDIPTLEDRKFSGMSDGMRGNIWENATSENTTNALQCIDCCKDG